MMMMMMMMMMLMMMLMMLMMLLLLHILKMPLSWWCAGVTAHVDTSARPPSCWGWAGIEDAVKKLVVLPFLSCVVLLRMQCCCWCSDVLLDPFARFCFCSGRGWYGWCPEDETHVVCSCSWLRASSFYFSRLSLALKFFFWFYNYMKCTWNVMDGICQDKIRWISCRPLQCDKTQAQP